jgi:RNA polymerase sigma factor for flagellar operon FliA
MIGLINAIDRYDPSRGVRFEAFATQRIRGAVIDQLRALNWLPRSAVARARQIEGGLAKLEQKLGRFANETEAAEEMGVTPQRYRQMLVEVSTTVLSLDAPLNALSQDDEIVVLGDLLEDRTAVSPIDQLEKQEQLGSLCEAVEHLPERERLVLTLYYQEECTMKEISRVIGVSESRVCQLHMQAIMHLRTALGQGEGKVVKKGVVVPLAAKERRVLKQQAKIVDENVVIRKRIRSQRRVS